MHPDSTGPGEVGDRIGRPAPMDREASLIEGELGCAEVVCGIVFGEGSPRLPKGRIEGTPVQEWRLIGGREPAEIDAGETGWIGFEQAVVGHDSNSAVVGSGHNAELQGADVQILADADQGTLDVVDSLNQLDIGVVLLGDAGEAVSAADRVQCLAGAGAWGEELFPVHLTDQPFRFHDAG